MLKNKNEFVASAPGRVCLFGEHQDYLNLPVIASAISLRVNVTVNKQKQKLIYLDLPDINSFEKFKLNGYLNYQKERDYFRSAVNVLQKNSYTFSSGLTGKVIGSIPINSGTSSSSALMVAWIKLLTKISDQSPDATDEEIADMAYSAEVLEFNEPGGKMDMYTSSVGGTIFLDFHPCIKLEKLSGKLGTFVLGDSGEPKDTTEVLARVKNPVIEIFESLKSKEPGFSVRNTFHCDIEKYKTILDNRQMNLLKATLCNYEITKEAREALNMPDVNHERIGDLLNKHHKILRDDLHISTFKIEKMIDSALKAGALGAKINGSGGGGCMFAYAPQNPQAVAESIEREGGKAYIIQVDQGVQLSEG